MDLVNNPKAYAILYHLVAIQLDITKRRQNPQNIKELEGKLDLYAAKAQEKNTQRDIEYSELQASQFITGGTAGDLNGFLRRTKLNIYDFTYTVSDMIPKLQSFKVLDNKNPLLKRRNLKELFQRQPWCVVTFKALGAEYHRKVKEKPQNQMKILACLVRFLEYAENGGDVEQWMFLQFILQKVKEIDAEFTFIG